MRKLLICFILAFLILTSVSCSGLSAPPEDTTKGETPKAVEVSIVPSKTTVAVGEKVDFEVRVSNAPEAKSLGIELQYDTDYFELVSGEMNIKGDLCDFSDGVGVVAFSNATDINNVVLLFTLKAKAKNEAEVVKCQISIKDKNDASVEVLSSNINKASINITAQN